MSKIKPSHKCIKGTIFKNILRIFEITFPESTCKCNFSAAEREERKLDTKLKRRAKRWTAHGRLLTYSNMYSKFC